MIRLSSRLESLATFVKPGSRVADIGTDHAYVPIWLLVNGVSPRCVASDIRPGPLDSARRNAEAYGVMDRIDFYLTDGLTGIDESLFDTVIIAGMGGDRIAAIMDAAALDKTYILQPMTKIPELCVYLHENGYYVKDELLSEDDGHIYRILRVIRGSVKVYNELDMYFGQRLFEKRSPLLGEYISRHISKLEYIISRMSDSKAVSDERERLQILLQKFQAAKGRVSW